MSLRGGGVVRRLLANAKKIHFFYLSLEIEFVEKRLNGSGDCCNIALIGSCRHISWWKKPYCGESLSEVVSTIDQLWSPPSWNWWSEEKGKEKRSVTTPLGKILREWKTLTGNCQKPKLAQLAVNECTRSFGYSIGTKCDRGRSGGYEKRTEMLLLSRDWPGPASQIWARQLRRWRPASGK